MDTPEVRQSRRRAGDIAGSPVERNLLCYWQPDTTGNNLAIELRDAGWNVHSANSLTIVDELTSSHTIPVGLVFLDSDAADSYLDDIYRVIRSTGDMIWFALLNDRRRMHDSVCDLVAVCCSDFYSPPYDSKTIIEALGHAAGMSLIRHRSMERREATAAFQGMVGDSPPMRSLFAQIQKVARSEAPVLLTGESGTGKELTACAVHRLSRRSNGPFVAVNCAALPPTLIQSELFGHEKGAFTGANLRRIGRLESAAGGTVFLDEISDMPLDQQVNLLRFLEEKCIERVGGNDLIPLDVRIVVATHDNLQQAVERGSFREDLYYRLNVLELEIPSLRDRVSDIELLASFVSRKFSEESGRHRKGGFDKQALQAMNAYPWPGNVRELINRVRRAMVMSEGRFISSIDLGLDVAENLPKATLRASRSKVDKTSIESALLHTHDNMSQAARELGISRTTLYRMINKFDIHSIPRTSSARPQ
jgi:DNA-binding NtrC family response regulator